MGVSSQTLVKEKNLLTKTFKELSDKIAETEKQMQVWKNNLNAVGGAIQQVDKLIKKSSPDKQEKQLLTEKQPMPAEKAQALNIATS
mgnify:CR=1 FL=1